MKTQRSFIALLCLVSVSLIPANGKTTPQPANMIVHLENGTEKTIGLRVSNLRQLRTTVSIADLDGTPWFKDYAHKENNYSKKLDLASLPSGDYLLRVENENETFVQAFAVQGPELVFFQATETEPGNSPSKSAVYRKYGNSRLISRFFVYDELRVGIQLSNVLDPKTKVQLHAPDGTVLFSSETGEDVGYAKKFILAGLGSGTYYFTIRSNDLLQIQFFSLEKETILLGERQVREMEVAAPGMVLN